MKTILRAALAPIALTVLLTATPAKAHAQDFCIPILTCPVTPPSSPSNDAPEISGSMLSTGLGLIAGVAMMVRGRRRSSN
jgi:hypothetical protein